MGDNEMQNYYNTRVGSLGSLLLLIHGMLVIIIIMIIIDLPLP